VTAVYRRLYRFLVAVRRWLNDLIDYARAKAYPQTGGRRRRVAHTENQPVAP
jgi:hypothetical protein